MVTFDYPGDEQWLCLNCLEEGESFFTQDERATLADVSERTQQRSDNYEKAGLGPAMSAPISPEGTHQTRFRSTP